MSQYDVFLSYDPAMAEQVSRIKTLFRENGITFTDATEFVAGTDYNTAFLQAVEQCKALVLIASPEIQENGSSVNSEVEIALKLKKKIIPYIARPFELNPSFQFLTGSGISIVADGTDEPLRKLTEAVNAVKAEPDVGKKPKKKLTMILVIAAAAVLIAAGALVFALLNSSATQDTDKNAAADSLGEATDSGSNGNLKWSYYEDANTLVISGKGEGVDYFDNTDSIPWQKYASDIYTVKIEEGVTYLGSYTFYQMDNLTDVSFPDTFEWMASALFWECTSLQEVEIPESVSIIAGGVFSYCDIRSLHIPASVSLIESSVCMECSRFEAFTVDEDSAFFKAVDGVLFDYDMTRLIQYPPAKTDTEFVMPNTVKTLDNGAFFGAESLEKLTLSDALTEIPLTGISGLSIKELTLPEGIVSIASYGIAGCLKLEKLELPQTLETLEMCAIYHCPKLREITIPDSVKEIENLAIGFGDNEEDEEKMDRYPVVIKAGKDSPAIEYAKKHGLEYQIIG